MSLPTGSTPGRFSGTVEAHLHDEEPYSYLLDSGAPALGHLVYDSDIRIHFDSPVIAR